MDPRNTKAQGRDIITRAGVYPDRNANLISLGSGNRAQKKPAQVFSFGGEIN